MTTFKANAAPVFFSWGGEKIIKVTEFPDTDFYKNQDGKYIDVGIRFKQVTIFFMPVWNYDVEWCGYIGEGNKYMDVKYQDISKAAQESKIDLPSDPESSISFWDKYGGKLAVIVLFGLYVIFQSSSGKTT